MKKALIFCIALKIFISTQANASCSMETTQKDIFTNTNISTSITSVSCLPKVGIDEQQSFDQQSISIEKAPVVIEINSKKKLQKILGFGAAVTDACLDNLEKLKTDEKQDLLKVLFSEKDGVGLSFLRIPLGSNDFSKGNYTLNDTPENTPDLDFKHYKGHPYFFKTADFVRSIYKLNPHLQTMLSPWTAPAWMKDTKSLFGGKIERKYFTHYARYLKKSVLEFTKLGVRIDYMSIMNEPLIKEAQKTWKFPQGFMSVEDQELFLSNHFIPMFEKWNLKPKLLLHDHNWFNGNIVSDLIKNPKIDRYAEGIAYHCYAGDLSTEKQRLKEFPNKVSFNTECTGQSGSTDSGASLEWWMKNMTVDTLKYGMSGALGWNLCLDNNGGPTNGGVNSLQGLVTIDPSDSKNPIKFNPEFYALAIASKNVQPDSYKVESTDTDKEDLINVAVLNPDHTMALIVRNNSKQAKSFVVKTDSEVSEQVLIEGKSAISLRIENK